MLDNCKTGGSRLGALDRELHTGLGGEGFLLHFQLEWKLNEA